MRRNATLKGRCVKKKKKRTIKFKNEKKEKKETKEKSRKPYHVEYEEVITEYDPDIYIG